MAGAKNSIFKYKACGRGIQTNILRQNCGMFPMEKKQSLLLFVDFQIFSVRNYFNGFVLVGSENHRTGICQTA